MKVLIIAITLGTLLALNALSGQHDSVFDSPHGDPATDIRVQDRPPLPLQSAPEALWGIPFSLLQGILLAIVLMVCYAAFL